MKQLNWYQIFGNTHTIPEGSTVTPTDDVQILLHCANIWDKSYTTIGEVIADDDTLFLTLIDNNAIDYLVRSTTFASSIVADESAMQYIGASDYASDTLLSDSTWLTAIDGSAYKDYVINASVPKMTSNTTPSGEVIATDYVSSYLPYKAFDGDNSTRWNSASGSGGKMIGYYFGKNVSVHKIKVRNQDASHGIKDIQLRASSDNVTWTDVGSQITVPANNTDNFFTIGGSAKDYYWALNITKGLSGNTDDFTVCEIQFYGRQNGGVQSWLKAGGITNKKYTTVSEVLSDLTTLATLMSSTDAIDYLVTAKGWATEICSDSNAMADIGLNNYAANTLLADETWKEAICLSTYFESVLNVKNPDMTDNTHPYGEISSSSPRSDLNANCYKTMDGDLTNNWDFGNANDGHWIKYRFVSPTKIYRVAIKNDYATENKRITAIDVLQGSNDDSTWTTVHNFNGNHGDPTVAVTNPGSYLYYKLIGNHYSTSGYGYGYTEIQYWGRKDI